jgi:hypothetical protein
MKTAIILDGNKFSDLSSFYDEVERVMTRDLDWKTGRNLDAFKYILRGGFGTIGPGEPVTLIWLNSVKSSRDLGYPETIIYWTEVLGVCHPSSRLSVQHNLDLAGMEKGPTLFQIITGIISEHAHIEFLQE